MVTREVMNETYKKGKGEEDKHPLFKNRSDKSIDEAIKSIRIKRLIRRIIKMINS